MPTEVRLTSLRGLIDYRTDFKSDQQQAMLAEKGGDMVTKTAVKPAKVEAGATLEASLVKALVVKLMARNEGRSVHTVYSGLNQALRDAGYNPIASTEEAVKAGVVFMRFCKGGALVGLKAFAQGDSAKTLAVKSDLSDILKAATRKS